jgi:RecA/RadA recombinase
LTNSHLTVMSALAYIRRGWAVVPLHDVVGGACSCGSADPEHHRKQGGKHPLWGGWQNRGLRDERAVNEAWASRPGANLGIVTGRASGVWVLDVDPDNGGDEKLAALVAAYGTLPETWTVRTGSGGRHYYWRMPDFDFTTSRGQLPVGLDVRGNAGQVVAPPSYTLKGPYEVLVPAEAVDAPGWLLGMIRPSEREAGAGPGTYIWEPGTAVDAGAADRGAVYAASAVGALLAELAATPPGGRNQAAYRVGRRLAELINSPWSGLDPEQVYHGYLAAAAACDVDGGFPQSEAIEVLEKAVRGQAGRGVGLPTADWFGTAWTPPVMPSDFDQAGQDPANPFSNPGQPGTSIDVAGKLINGPTEQPQPADAWEGAVVGEVSRLLVREEAQRRVQAYHATSSPIRIMDREALRQMPRSQPLIAGWMGRGQAVRIYGPPGSGKSFVAIDMAACVAQGRPWHGYPVHQGEVVYFAVEDAEGVAMRLRAWELHHQTEHRVHVVSTPVQLNVPTVHRVLAALRAYFEDRAVALVVLDTQAMITIGLDENSTQDMGIFVEAVKLLIAETGATVLIVHHSGVKGGRARGATAIRGAMDVELEASMVGIGATLSSTKQKNISDPPALMANLNVVDLAETNELGQAITSCVLLSAQDATGPFTSPAGPQLSPLQRRAQAIATALVETAATGETYARLRVRAAAMTDFGKTAASVTSGFSKAWAYLVERGRIAKAPGREAYYFIDVEGLDRLSASPFKAVVGGPEVYLGETES